MLVPWDYGATGGQLASDEARRMGRTSPSCRTAEGWPLATLVPLS